jgi:hypothetical protein
MARKDFGPSTGISKKPHSALPEEEPEVVDLPGVMRPLVAVRNARHPILSRAELRDAPPPPDGYRYTLDGRLVPLGESTTDIATVEAQAIACEIVEKTGSLQAAADALCIRLSTLKLQLRKDVEFQEAMDESADRHRQAIYQSAYQRAVVGYDVPIVGGKEKNEIVAYERRYSDTLTALMLKRHFTEFREAAKPVANVTVTNNTLNVDSNIDEKKLAKLTREERAVLKKILKDQPEDTTPVLELDTDADAKDLSSGQSADGQDDRS